MAAATGNAVSGSEEVKALLEVEFVSLPLSEFRNGDRRLDSETYLTGGYEIRRAIETARRHDAADDISKVWQPSRLKGIKVSSQFGRPFLTATQVFDIRPLPRKWIAPSKTIDLEQRYVQRDWILLTCSGSVGDAILTYAPHDGQVISHDILRIQPRDSDYLGYIYGFLRTRFGRTMLRSTKYGSIIKHLEPEHVAAIPVPQVDQDLARALTRRTLEIYRLRSEAYQLQNDAENEFASHFQPPAKTDEMFTTKAREMFSTRRRLEGFYHNPQARAVLSVLRRGAVRTEELFKRAKVFGVGRFKHVYKSQGIPYLDSEDLFKVNPELTKFIPEQQKTNAADYFVKRDWLLMACSGQLYGLIGNTALAGAWHESKIVSNHVIRIAPSDIDPGYLHVAMSHSQLGRPLITRLAFGTEVPEIAPLDLEQFPLTRLDNTVESRIGDLARSARDLRERADRWEEEMVAGLEKYLSWIDDEIAQLTHIG